MSLLDLIFPRRCLGCGRFGSYLCSHCINKIQPIHTPICPVCQTANFHGLTHTRCLTPHGLDGLVSCFPYKGVIKHAVKKLKFQFVKDLTHTLIECAISLIDFTPLEKDTWLVTPVPLHPRRHRWRGFNQADNFAKSLSQSTHWHYHPDLLKRTKHTKPQSLLKGDERRQNLLGAFEFNNQTPSNKPLIRSHPTLLIDDVWTTGTTLKECAKVLKRNGAKKVIAFTLARTV